MIPAIPKWFRGALVALIQVAALQPAALRAQDNGTPTLPATAQHEAFAQATRDFREQRYAAAYGRFARLADSGHVPSDRRPGAARGSVSRMLRKPPPKVVG